MAFKDLLLQVGTYPEATHVTVVEYAIKFAEVLNARITALALEIDLHAPSNVLVNLVLNIPGMVAAERAKSVANGRDLVKAFETAATKRGLVHDHVIERCSTNEAPGIVTDYARMRDLTIMPVENPADSYIAECVIFGSGRPVLILPAKPKTAAELEVVGVAWDFGRPAARAVADALPILQRAKTVRVVTVTNEKTIETRRSSAELARHLASHGVAVILDEENAAGESIGQTLEAYAAKHGLDLLVMGAYGHWRMRDFFLGGATKSIVANPPLPVLLSH